MLRAQDRTKKEVLVLNSYRSDYAWTSSIGQAFRSLLENEPYPIEIWHEYMDASRRPPAEFRDELRRELVAKYAGRKLDLIVSTDDEALVFLAAHHDELFSGIPVVFCGVNNAGAIEDLPRAVFTGVREVFSNNEFSISRSSSDPAPGE